MEIASNIATQANSSQFEIENYILKKIRGGEYGEDDKLPSLNKLSTLFRVNMNVVRRSMDRLNRLGYIYTLKGKGSFVAKKSKVVAYPIFHSNKSFGQNMDKMGLAHKSSLLSWVKCAPSREEKEGLKLTEDNLTLYRLEILRQIEGKPFGLYISSIPEASAPELERYLDDFTSLHKILKENYGYQPICSSVTIEAESPTAKDISVLGISEQIPVIKTVNINLHPDRRPVEYCVTRIRGDMLKYYLKSKS